MKRLLYIASAICLFFMACNNGSGKEAQDQQDPADSLQHEKPMIQDSLGDTTGQVQELDSVTTEETPSAPASSQTTKSNIEKKDKVTEAPKHGSSDAEALRKMKEEKNKKKK